MKETSKGLMFTNGKKMTEEQQQEILVHHIHEEDVWTITTEMKLDVCTVQKYIGLYENSELST